MNMNTYLNLDHIEHIYIFPFVFHLKELIINVLGRFLNYLNFKQHRFYIALYENIIKPPV